MIMSTLNMMRLQVSRNQIHVQNRFFELYFTSFAVLLLHNLRNKSIDQARMYSVQNQDKLQDINEYQVTFNYLIITFS